jgi:predicted glycosyltransferase
MGNEPTNNFEALVAALALAITAPTDEQAARATELAEAFAATLHPDQVTAAQAQAQAEVAS